MITASLLLNLTHATPRWQDGIVRGVCPSRVRQAEQDGEHGAQIGEVRSREELHGAAKPFALFWVMPRPIPGPVPKPQALADGPHHWANVSRSRMTCLFDWSEV
jgi:hypothetical protein